MKRSCPFKTSPDVHTLREHMFSTILSHLPLTGTAVVMRNVFINNGVVRKNENSIPRLTIERLLCPFTFSLKGDHWSDSTCHLGTAELLGLLIQASDWRTMENQVRFTTPTLPADVTLTPRVQLSAASGSALLQIVCITVANSKKTRLGGYLVVFLYNRPHWALLIYPGIMKSPDFSQKKTHLYNMQM